MRMYRGKPVDNPKGDFVKGGLIKFDGRQYIFNEDETGHEFDWAGREEVSKHEFLISLGFIEVIPETVSQSTGLKDKNKKEGWQKDIVKDGSGNKYLIVWHDKDACFYLNALPTKCMFPMRDLKRFEIIGNVHDNPALKD